MFIFLYFISVSDRVSHSPRASAAETRTFSSLRSKFQLNKYLHMTYQ